MAGELSFNPKNRLPKPEITNWGNKRKKRKKFVRERGSICSVKEVPAFQQIKLLRRISKLFFKKT